MIRINVFIQVSDANRAKVLESAKDLTANSLKEVGCIAYDVFESTTRPDVLMICETWADQAVIDAHQKTAHFITEVGKIQQLASMKIEKFDF